MYERQVGRLQKQQILLSEMLNKLIELGGNDDLVDAILQELRNDPEELAQISQEIESVVGSGFSVLAPRELGSFHITEVYRIVKSISMRAVEEGFGAKSLAVLQLRIEARSRLEGRKIEPKDYNIITLRQYFEARHRRVDYFRDLYRDVTSERSNERYTVERRRTRQVPDGTDKDGNTKYRTKVYYVDETVVPRFENILSGRYDTGDGSVSGLSPIKRRAEEMVKLERPPRRLLKEAESFYEDLIEDYQDVVADNDDRARRRQGITGDLIPRLESMIDYQRGYMERPSLYSRDDPDNHRRRNEEILKRLINMRDHLIVMAVFLDRREIRLHPIYDMYNFNPRMEFQDGRRVRTHVIQGVLGTSVTGSGGAYVLSPEVQNFVDNHIEAFIQMLQNTPM